MRVFVFVNRIQEIGYRQTTALLIAAFHRKGYEVFLANVNGLSVASGTNGAKPKSPLRTQDFPPTFSAMSVCVDMDRVSASSQHLANFAGGLEDKQFIPTEITSNDIVFIRTNPGRDLANSNQHTTFLESCQVAKSSGIKIINDPSRLGFFASKAAVLLMPDRFRPEMLVTQDLEAVGSFITDAKQDCVAKPLLGSRGNDVIRLDASADIEKELSRFDGRTVVVQHFVDSDEPGDKRVVVLNGKLLEHNGHVAGIHRIPADGDFRANLMQVAAPNRSH